MGSEDEYMGSEDDGQTYDEEDVADYGDEEDVADYGDEEDVAEYDESDKLGDDRLAKNRYTVLKEETIRELQQQDVTQVSNTLLIPRLSATILLQHYNWEVDTAQDAWFANEEKVRKDVGLLEEHAVPIQNMETVIKCRICFDEFGPHDMCAAACGHLFCKVCWTQYVSIKISDGPGCLKFRCPDPSCTVAVGQDMVNELVSDENKEKYSNYLYRSYVEDRRNTRWCPGPGCENAVEFVVGSSSSDVVCGCGHSFCWNCGEDAHRPVDCDTVHQWVVKNSSESENVTWILANSKSCPKCKKPIQKNEGCMHMTCRCTYEFCWLCLGDWKTHERSGSYYACNVYEKAKAEGKYEEEEKIKKKAKDYLDRYAFFYERFAQNQKSREKAVESLQKTQSDDLKELSKKYGKPETDLVYITDAWLQIIECRRFLKWSYAYGYYLPASKEGKTQFFQGLQGDAEINLEKLHRCAEVELQTYLQVDDAPEDLRPFQEKLVRLTNVTKDYFENLSRGLENGLTEVEC